MLTFRGVVAASALSLCSLAQAGISFSFADPAGGRQLTNIAGGGGPGISRLTYSATTPITFIVDTGLEGVTTFSNARLELTNMDMGAAQVMGMFTIAPVTGSFTFYDFTGGVRTNIVTGTSTNGAFVRIGLTNAFMFSSANGFLYSPGPALVPLLGTTIMSGQQEAVFSVTDILTAGGPITGAGGVFNDFTANSSYSGNTQTIPTAGTCALLLLGGASMARRRR